VKRPAIYARISTHEGRQHLKNQVAKCEQFIGYMAPTQNWDPQPDAQLPVYTDEITGSTMKRPGIDSMLADAARRDFDVLVVFDLSRLTRGGPAEAFRIIEQLHSYGIEFWSINEPHFRTSGLAGELLIAISAFIAKEERRAIQQRVKAGIQRARAAGRILGRPVEAIDPVALLG
jgi:DNA invertase Pin-like site-specific DNA recombinase